MPVQHLVQLEAQINLEADNTGWGSRDYFASSWGKTDWSIYAGGVFNPLYEAILDERIAALNLGTLIQSEMCARLDLWVFSHDPDAGTELCPRNMWGSFYWRADRAVAA